MTKPTAHARPPILRFLLLFAALLGMGMGLAALAPTTPADVADAATPESSGASSDDPYQPR